jgi:hypothetical protein
VEGKVHHVFVFHQISWPEDDTAEQFRQLVDSMSAALIAGTDLSELNDLVREHRLLLSVAHLEIDHSELRIESVGGIRLQAEGWSFEGDFKSVAGMEFIGAALGADVAPKSKKKTFPILDVSVFVGVGEFYEKPQLLQL